MKITFPVVLFATLSAFILAANPVFGDASEEMSIRQPVWAGRFYPSQKEALKHMIDDLAQSAGRTTLHLPTNKALKAIVLPHAGYIYSGKTAAHAVHVLSGKSYAKVIILAPDHRVGLANAAISDVSAYRTPLGTIRLHPDAAALRSRYDVFEASPLSDNSEHAVEVVLPFLQYFLIDFKLVPIVLGHVDTAQFADIIAQFIDDDTLLVISSDLSHFLPYDEAVIRDHHTIETILALDAEALIRQKNAACGQAPLAILLKIAKSHNWKPVLLHYANSGDTAGDKKSVVGYAAIAFFEDGKPEAEKGPQNDLSPSQGRLLAKLARRIIEGKLIPEKSRDISELTQALAQIKECHHRCGTFVTLTRHGQLRGCMGNLDTSRSILEGIKQNALNAAFHDPRFPPLNPEELEVTAIEISILTEPEPLDYEDGPDLVSKLHINEDGVLIRKGPARATFLPQVWEQLPTPELFLSRLCLKAGLPPDAWQKTKLDVMTYQVRHYNE